MHPPTGLPRHRNAAAIARLWPKGYPTLHYRSGAIGPRCLLPEQVVFFRIFDPKKFRSMCHISI